LASRPISPNRRTTANHQCRQAIFGNAIALAELGITLTGIELESGQCGLEGLHIGLQGLRIGNQGRIHHAGTAEQANRVIDHRLALAEQAHAPLQAL
jgi:hypothetical protein